MLEAQAIEGRLHPGREAGAEGGEVEVDVHVGEDGAPGLEARHPFQGEIDMGVGRVRVLWWLIL